MRNNLALLVACIVMFFCSCNKENVNNIIPNNTSSNNLYGAEALTLKPSNMVNYGALIGTPTTIGSMNFQVNVANQVGISCIRSRVNVPSTGKVSILDQGYKILLNFNSDYEGTPLPFVSDITKYQLDLKNIVAGFTNKPVVAVIENEESNLLFYSGTAQDYIRQLSAAVTVMHSYGIKVANGGITSTGLNYLVYQDFMSQGKVDSAKDFQTRVHLNLKSLQAQDRGAFIDALLQAYTQMDLDYVNFHWKGTSPDTQALNEVINYLKKRTGKAIISNELGQFDTDPNTLLAHVQLCTDRGFPYIIWYSPDENAGKREMPLQHSDQSLTTNGVAYKNYLRN